MPSSYYVEVVGQPKPQPRPRLGYGGRVFNPSSADEWKRAVAKACRDAKVRFGKGVPIAIDIEFRLPARGAVTVGAPHLSTPDIDNLAKAVLDAMTRAKAWHDDSQVYCLTTRKTNAGGPFPAGASITVSAVQS